MKEIEKKRGLLFQNLANAITGLGIFLSFWLLMVAIMAKEQVWLVFLLVLMIGLTDFIDGRIARHMKIESHLGKVMDRLRDKLFICPTLFILAWYYWPLYLKNVFVNTITAALVLSIVLIEVLLFVAGFIGVFKKWDVSSNEFGKIKMFGEFITVVFWLLCLNIEKYLEIPVMKFCVYLINAALAVILYFSVKSLAGYYQRHQKAHG